MDRAAHGRQAPDTASRHVSSGLPAPNAGRSPADAELAATARRQLQWLNDLPCHDLAVAVADGWITLSGVVTWDYQRLAALGALRDLPGVAGLRDHVELVPTALAAAIRYEIEAELRVRAGAQTQAIEVTVTRVDVRLGGTARSQAERDAACRLAATTPFVRRVLDHISVMPAPVQQAAADQGITE